MIDIFEYLLEEGSSPFRRWFNKINAIAAARISTALIRMEQGNLSTCKSLGGGLWENKLVFGPGYRIYFGKDG